MIPCYWLEFTGEYERKESPSGGAVSRPLFRRPDTGEVITLEKAAPGAVYDADWFHDLPGLCGPDGRAIVVVTPGGLWHVDTEASNCTRRGDLSHKCWVRHGDPTDPRGPDPLHVDKNGNTCAAGAGSIICGGYHGFLHRGYLTPA